MPRSVHEVVPNVSATALYLFKEHPGRKNEGKILVPVRFFEESLPGNKGTSATGETLSRAKLVHGGESWVKRGPSHLHRLQVLLTARMKITAYIPHSSAPFSRDLVALHAQLYRVQGADAVMK